MILHDVVSLAQLKSGIEASMGRYREAEGVPPSLEEWGALSILIGKGFFVRL